MPSINGNADPKSRLDHAFRSGPWRSEADRGIEADLALLVDGIRDYAKNKPISHGRFRPQAACKREMDAGEWMQVFGKAARAVV